MGGYYERTCRQMIIAGAEWLERHPIADSSYSELENAYETLQDVMSEASGTFGCTGAMMQACLSHVLFIQKNGWDGYVAKMTESKEAEEVVEDMEQRSDFEIQLQKLLNQTCQENASDTPDYILAQYLTDTLRAFNVAVRDRDRHYGYKQPEADLNALHEHKCCDHNH